MQRMNEQPIIPPRMIAIRDCARKGPLTEYTLRKMIAAGTLPTKTITIGKKILINYDLLLENLSKCN